MPALSLTMSEHNPELKQDPEFMHTMAIAMMEHALVYIKKLPFKAYGADKVVRAMVSLEKSIAELKEAKQ